jgi:hypothetical protein
MKKENKLKLAGALLGATLITATAGVADETKSTEAMSKSETMMTDKDAKMTSEEMAKKKKEMQEHAKAADAKHATSKWG